MNLPMSLCSWMRCKNANRWMNCPVRCVCHRTLGLVKCYGQNVFIMVLYVGHSGFSGFQFFLSLFQQNCAIVHSQVQMETGEELLNFHFNFHLLCTSFCDKNVNLALNHRFLLQTKHKEADKTLE